MDDEWRRHSVVGDAVRPLLTQCGWGPGHLWVMDLQTLEGAAFRHGGYAKADLDKHRIWVCPLFEPFLTWLYTQDAAQLGELPQPVILDAPLALAGYRRSGGTDEGEQAVCCDLHGRNCEPPSELCCEQCTESHHNGMTTLAAPYHSDGTLCSNPDLSGGW